MLKTMTVAAGLALTFAAAGAQGAEGRTDALFGRTPFRPAHPITAEQRALLAEKIGIVDRAMRSAMQGKELSIDHRMWLMETLYRMPVAELRAMSPDIGHEGLLKVATKAAKGPAKLGATNTELVYYPITPCRYVDTRNVGGPLGGTPRQYDLANTGTPYGGSGACSPKAAVGGNEDLIGALAINLTIVAPTAAPGFVGARPVGSSASTSLVNWYNSGAGVQAANAGVVTTDQSGATNEIEFFGSPTQFIVDVFGVFAAPTATPLDCVNGTVVTANASAAARTFQVFSDACPTGYTMVSNSCQVINGFVNDGTVTLAAQGAGPGVITPFTSNCVGHYSGSGTVTIENTPWCCRIPGR